MKKLSLLVGLSLFSSLVYADNSPVSVTPYISQGAHIISIQSNENRVTVNDVIVNRGNCSLQHRDGKRTLLFGQEITYYLLNCSISRIKEIQVKTDLGTSTFSSK